MSKKLKYPKAISSWPEQERPREKLLKHGEHTLTSAELLAILLRSGVKGDSAVDLGRKILQKFKNFRDMSHSDITKWREIKGLGDAKIAQIKAAIEIGRRFMTEEKEIEGKVTSSKEVADLFMPRFRDLKKEVFKILLLNGKNEIMNTVEIEEGTINYASPPVREIIHKALQEFASAIICVHNHPSGNPQPSDDDKRFTKELSLAGKIMQVKVLDHIIIGDNNYFSFADEGLMRE